jgi:glycine cleavage system H protein
VESVKAVSEVLSPYTGIVAEVNGALMDAPQRINEAPYDSWFIRVTNITEHDEFLSAKEYEDLIAGGE